MTRDGALITVGNDHALRFERRYGQPLERVWRAITAPDEMGKWFPSHVKGERRVGAELIFDDDAQRAAAEAAGELARAEGPMFRGRVVVHDPPHVFAFTWGGELLRFELTAEGDETVLRFTHVLSHPSVAARNGAGWHACLARLNALLGAPVKGDEAEWSTYEAYVASMGPAPGVPARDGTMTWERYTHVSPEQVRSAGESAQALAEWGALDASPADLQWDIQPAGEGTIYCVTTDVHADAEQAAKWHALLLQLDMYLAAGQLVGMDHEPFVALYEPVLLAQQQRGA